NLSTAAALSNLGYLQRRLGRFQEAERSLKRALDVRESILPDGHPEIAMALRDLAYLIMAQRIAAENEALVRIPAEQLASRIDPPRLDAQWKALLDEMTTTARRLQEIEPLFRRSLRMQEVFLPPDHPDNARTLHSLSLIGAWRKDWANAYELLENATDLLIR